MWHKTLLSLTLVMAASFAAPATAGWPGIYWWQKEVGGSVRACVARAKNAFDEEGFYDIKVDSHETADVGSVWGHTDNEASYIICRKVDSGVVATVVVSGDNNKNIKRYRDLLRDAM